MKKLKEVKWKIKFFILYTWGVWVALIEAFVLSKISENVSSGINGFFLKSALIFILIPILFVIGLIVKSFHNINEADYEVGELKPSMITFASNIVILHFIFGYGWFLTGLSACWSAFMYWGTVSDFSNNYSSSSKNKRVTETTHEKPFWEMSTITDEQGNRTLVNKYNWTNNYSTTTFTDENGKETTYSKHKW